MLSASSGRRPLKRVVIVQRYLPHYRRAFFARLAQTNPDLSIEVYHGGPLDQTDASLPESIDFPERIFQTYQLPTRLGYNFVIQPGVFWSLVRYPPDLVILEGTFGVLTNILLLLWRRVQRHRTVYWAAGWDNPRVHGWRRLIKTGVVRGLLSFADGFIVYGSAARDYLLEHGARPGTVTVAQNTIDVETILHNADKWQAQGQALRERLGWSHYQVMVYVGGISRMKRLSILIKACAQLKSVLPSLALLVAGDGPDLPAMQTLAAELELPHVNFAGAVVEGVEAYFAAGDVFVMPGTGGLALNQAMALRKPLIATVADGTQLDLIDPGRNGFLAQVDNVSDLAECIRRVLADPQRAEQMGEESRRILLERATLGHMVTCFSFALRSALFADSRQPVG